MSDNLNLQQSLGGLIALLLEEAVSAPNGSMGVAIKNILKAAGNPDDEVYQMVPVEIRQMALAALPLVKKQLRGVGLEIE